VESVKLMSKKNQQNYGNQRVKKSAESVKSK